MNWEKREPKMIFKVPFTIDQTQKSSLINMALKPISMILALVYTPLLLSYLGDEKYGLWSTVISVISWINYCDIGIGQGLRNLLSKELTQKQIEKAKKSVSTAYIILTGISLILLLLSIFIVFHLNWYSLFNTKINMRSPMAISIVFICLNFVLTISNSLLYALQLSERVALRQCLIQVFNILGLLLINKFTSGSLILMAIQFGMSSLSVYLWNTVFIFRNYQELSPHIKYFDKNKIKEIANVGIKFFLIQLSCIALYTVDNILITNLFGAKSVTPFNIVYKTFNTCYAILSAIVVPYWSQTTSAIAQNDFKWIKKSIIQLNIIAMVFNAGFILLALLFKPLAYLWLGRTLDYAPGLIFVMCLYYCFYSIVTVNIQFINGTGKINCQLIIMTFMGILNIPLSILLAKNLGMGVVGIRLATTILMGCAAIIFPINLYCIIRRLQNKSIKVGLK